MATFDEMCKGLLNKEHPMAVRSSYPDLNTTIRLRENEQSGDMLFYYVGENTPQVPFVITKELFEADDYEFLDSMDERLTIPNFMRMPFAKEFLREFYDAHQNTYNGRMRKPLTMTPAYQSRLAEAISLKIIFPDERHRRFVFTDIGESLIKTL